MQAIPDLAAAEVAPVLDPWPMAHHVRPPTVLAWMFREPDGALLLSLLLFCISQVPSSKFPRPALRRKAVLHWRDNFFHSDITVPARSDRFLRYR